MLDPSFDYEALRFVDRATRVRFRRMENWLLARVRGSRRALDLACGTGRLSVRVPAAKVVGLDISKPMLAVARQRGLTVVQGDGNALPFASGAFDTVICTDSAFGLLEPCRALAECARVLAVDGLLGVHYPTDRVWSMRSPWTCQPNPGAPPLSGHALLARAAAHGLVLEASALFRWLRFPPYLIRVWSPVHYRLWNHALFVWRKAAVGTVE